MRFLHVIPSIDPCGGGPAEGVRQLCVLYRMAGHDVEVASLDDSRSLAGLDFPATVHALGPAWGIYGLSLHMLPWIRKNAHRFDVVILNSIWQYSTVAAWLALYGSGIPYAVFTHGMLDPYFRDRYPLKHLKKCVYWELILRRILNNADTIFFTAEEEKVLARQSFRGYKVHETVVPYGSFGPECDLQIARESFLTQWSELRGKRLLNFMGRIHPKKGIDYLIEAFSRTMAMHEDVQLVIAGPDQVGWKTELERLAERFGVKEKITWTGMLRGEMKWGALAASEVFVLPSHQENFGIVVAEAMACSLPVILSNKINIWRECAQYWAGLVDNDTVEGTVSSLSRWAELNASEIEALRARSKSCFDRYFNLNYTADRLVGSVEKLARQKSDPACGVTA